MQPTTFPGLIAALVAALTTAYRTDDETTWYAALAAADHAFGALLRFIADRRTHRED